jgi:hypothetical protein
LVISSAVGKQARPFYLKRRIHKDGETITVSFPKDEASGFINNQLDSLILKVRAQLSTEACKQIETGHACHMPCQLPLITLSCLNFAIVLQFDGVLENVSQDTVYNACAHDAVNSVLAGVNACVFCYGQVGLQCSSSNSFTSNFAQYC